MKSYHFMWGQKQSAMICEIMHLTSGPESDLLNVNQPETLPIMVNGTYAHYLPDESIAAWRANGMRFDDKDFAKKLFDDVDLLIDHFFVFCTALKEKDLSSLSNPELKEIVLEYKKIHLDAMNFFGASTPSATWHFIALSTPAEMDATMKERLDFLKLVASKVQNGVISDDDLRKHAETYPALFFNTYSEKDALVFLRDRLDLEKGKSVAEEEQRIQKNLTKIKEQHTQIHAEVQSDDLAYYADILQKSGLYRYRLKHVWSGAEYMCLNLLYELQKRIGVNFEDFIKVYMFCDILHFLDTGEILTTEQILERKKCMVLHYLHGESTFYFGDEGLALRDRLITKKDEMQKEITGMVANKGIVRAKARVVHVKDLASFTKDSSLFQTGEILVTTMTSPLMVPLIEKAAGIITDEGGICSHAAVISREFGVPCIIGTKGASFVINTGDEIELDANKGTVKILNQ
jgi:phosphohistidine swiveling domain-containing protein